MMALIRRSPVALRAVDPFMGEFERMARRFWDSWEWPEFDISMQLKTDMHLENDDLVVKAELPGIDREEINLSLKDNVLTVVGEKKVEEEGRNEHRKYHRTITLPVEVDAEKVSATYENGLLEIRLPKAPELKTKHIEVKALEEPKAKTKAKAPKVKGTKKTKKPKTESKK